MYIEHKILEQNIGKPNHEIYIKGDDDQVRFISRMQEPRETINIKQVSKLKSYKGW